MQKYFCLNLYLFQLKAEYQIFKFEFCQVKLKVVTGKISPKQNFAQVGLQLEFAF